MPSGASDGIVQGNIRKTVLPAGRAQRNTSEEKMKLSKYGRRQWLAATVILVAGLLVSGVLMYFVFPAGCFFAAASLLVWGAFVTFFRDPHRVIGQDKTELVAPADGIVKDMELIPNASCEEAVLRELFEGYDILRIGITQSLFDVHIDRMPCPVTVKVKESREKTEEKEDSSFLLLGGTGEIEDTQFPVALKQISGGKLCRIVCKAEVGDRLKKGARYGMIRYGSRMELYLPAKSPVSIIANTGERVHAGKTVLAVFSREKQV